MIQNERNIINNPKTIAGIFREALFQSRPFLIRTLEDEIEVEFLNFDENKNRDQISDSYLVLEATSPISAAALNSQSHTVEFSCNFLKFVARWSGSPQKTGPNSYRVLLPANIEITNQRKSTRLPVGLSQTLGSPVLLITDGVHVEAQFKVDDYSPLGLGGTLQAINEMPVRQGSQIFGLIRSSRGGIEVAGELVQVQLKTEASKTTGETVYKVGVRNNPTINTPSKVEDPDRRNTVRVPAKLTVEVKSPFKPEHIIQLNLQDASCAGFLCQLVDPADSVLLPVGCMATFADCGLIARVVKINGNSVHLEIAGGSDVDRTNWLKRLTPFHNPNTSIASPTGLDIVNLFCDSGASASEYLKNQRRFADKFVAGFSSSDVSGPWVHRWIERDANGEIKGHVSAVRVSDQAWYIGDIAGMSSKERKISNKFLPRFMGYLRDYAVSSSPCPAFLLSWVEGHPYWKEFEENLKNRDRQFVLGFTRTRYHRVGMAAINDKEKHDSGDLKWIEASDYQLIILVREKLNSLGQLFLADCFDFSISSFGSPILRNQISKNEQEFKRNYGILQFDGEDFLVIYQNYPLGTSPLRTEDVPWIVPLDKRFAANDSSVKLLANRIRIAGLKKGFSFPGIMLVEINANQEIEKSKPMLWTLTHPNGMAYLYKDR